MRVKPNQTICLQYFSQHSARLGPLKFPTKASVTKTSRKIPEEGIFLPSPKFKYDSRGNATIFSLLWTAIIGLIVGAIAKLIIPGKDPGGITVTMLIGIAGAFLGSYLGRLVGHYQPGQSAGFLMSLVGALMLLGIYHLIKRAQSSQPAS